MFKSRYHSTVFLKYIFGYHLGILQYYKNYKVWMFSLEDKQPTRSYKKAALSIVQLQKRQTSVDYFKNGRISSSLPCSPFHSCFCKSYDQRTRESPADYQCREQCSGGDIFHCRDRNKNIRRQFFHHGYVDEQQRSPNVWQCTKWLLQALSSTRQQLPPRKNDRREWWAN